MLKKLLCLTFIFALPLGAKILLSPLDAMKNMYGKESKITKKNILLSKKNSLVVSKIAKTKLRSKIFRVYKASKDGNLLGYGILLNRKVRSKNAAILYMISSNSILQAIEIIAFNEPMEYIPSSKWNAKFKNISTSTMLRTSKEIPSITGATLSAKSITDGSRIAFAFYNQILKK